MDFYSVEDVEKHIMQSHDVREALRKTANEIVEEIQEYIYVNWYMVRPESEHYDRTYQLLSAFRVRLMQKSSSREIGVKIYIDDSRIDPEITDKDKWNVHASQATNEDNSADFPIFIDEGVKSPLYSYDGIYYMEELKRIMEETDFPLEKMKTYLHGKGYVVDF